MLIIENDGTVGELKNWVWCEDCLDWKNTEEVSFLGIEDNSFGKEILTFECDKCRKCFKQQQYSYIKIRAERTTKTMTEEPILETKKMER